LKRAARRFATARRRNQFRDSFNSVILAVSSSRENEG
jgi:hypothetical protein